MEPKNINKLQLIIDLLNNLPERVPEHMKLGTCDYKGIDLLNHGTKDVIDANNKGVLITTTELKPFIQYLEQCKSNGEAKDIVIGLYTHSNNRKLNNGIGLCDYKDADFAEISVVTTEKTISLRLNSMEPINRKVGHYVKVQNIKENTKEHKENED